MKLKCIKCGLRYNERDDNFPDGYVHDLCWNCGFIWQTISITLKSLSQNNPFMTKPLNRNVSIHLKDVKIEKHVKPRN